MAILLFKEKDLTIEPLDFHTLSHKDFEPDTYTNHKFKNLN